ncbi:Type II restriction/modification system, DNA methylase subunit YeeA, partial [Hymenobacter gelipurpurascens]
MPLPIPLPWPRIRENALKFAHEYRNAVKENEDAQSFWNDFFNVFGKKRRGTARFEYAVRKRATSLPSGVIESPDEDLGPGRIDLFWPGVLLAESKSRDKHPDLDAAYKQALEYIGGLPAYERPQYVFTSDFARLRFYDLRNKTVLPTADDHVEIAVAELGKHVRLFGFMAGYEQRRYQEQDPVNRQAAERMGKLHDKLEASGYRGADLERYLVRLLFCLFAEDTDIFPRASFMDLVSNHAGPRGQQLGPLLHQFFEVLDTPEDQRPDTLPDYLREFPYVNGGLFKGNLRTVAFDETMRQLLLSATRLDWGQISPAIFGSLFQSVMNDEERRIKGAHYTSEANILKAIGPLFLDELRAELNHLGTLAATTQRDNRLRELQNRLAGLRLFDPACGCGNFLVVAYRELRLLELDLLALLYPDQGGTQFPLGVETAVRLTVEQMHGIELDEFAARIAEVALWLVDHQMNQRLSERFGHYMARIPLRQHAHIRHGNALSTDWSDVLPREQATHVLGNPPFVGKSLQTDEQKAELLIVLQGTRGAGNLDYVAGWYWKTAQYIQRTNARAALVSTNSIVQGEQVSLLWGPLLGRFGMHIQFAHQTFKWSNEGKKNAAVHCVIIGFGPQEVTNKRLFTYSRPTSLPEERVASRINPYLVDAPIVVLPNRRRPLCQVSPMIYGSKPADGGNLIMTDEEKQELLLAEPEAAPFVREYAGSDEFISGTSRWCLWLKDAEPNVLRKLTKVMARVKRVEKMRLDSDKESTREWANSPTLFTEDRQPTTDYLLVPIHSSESRIYVPFAFLSAEVVVGNSCMAIPNASLYTFGVVTSAMHMAWLSYVCGRIKSDYRYSNTIVYNNFPWPESPV